MVVRRTDHPVRPTLKFTRAQAEEMIEEYEENGEFPSLPLNEPENLYEQFVQEIELLDVDDDGVFNIALNQPDNPITIRSDTFAALLANTYLLRDHLDTDAGMIDQALQVEEGLTDDDIEEFQGMASTEKFMNPG